MSKAELLKKINNKKAFSDMKHFIDEEIYYQGKKQPPRKVYLPIVLPNTDEETALCYDEDGADYTLPLTAIKE